MYVNAHPENCVGRRSRSFFTVWPVRVPFGTIGTRWRHASPRNSTFYRARIGSDVRSEYNNITSIIIIIVLCLLIGVPVKEAEWWVSASPAELISLVFPSLRAKFPPIPPIHRFLIEMDTDLILYDTNYYVDNVERQSISAYTRVKNLVVLENSITISCARVSLSEIWKCFLRINILTVFVHSQSAWLWFELILKLYFNYIFYGATRND